MAFPFCKVAFIAETKKPKNTPFFPTKSSGTADSVHGQEYLFREEFGEQLVGKAYPVIVVVDLASLKVKALQKYTSDESL